MDMNKISKLKSQTKASKILNISLSSISRCCRGKAKTAGGCIFKFLDDKSKIKLILPDYEPGELPLLHFAQFNVYSRITNDFDTKFLDLFKSGFDARNHRDCEFSGFRRKYSKISLNKFFNWFFDE